MPSLTIITASINSPEWAKLLICSVRKFTTMAYEVAVVDNGSLFNNLLWLEAQDDVNLIKVKENRGHGAAMDTGTALAGSRFVCFLDVDSHIMRPGWAEDLFDIYNSDPKIKLIGCLGPVHKPLHPPLMFYEKEFIIKNGISFKHVPPHSTDTAQKAYWDIIRLGDKVHRLEKGAKKYGLMGDEIHIKGQPTIYHHWYGTRFRENDPAHTIQELDGYKLEEYLQEKAKLYQQPLVQEILGITKRHADQTMRFRDYMRCRDMMLLNGGLPWIESGAIRMMEERLNGDSRILEIGAGSSTIWFASRTPLLTSFESNEVWYNIVKDELELSGMNGIDLRYDPDYPKAGLRDLNGKYDIILIDGETQGREDFVDTAIKHIRKGGLIVLDDSQRKELYKTGIDRLNSRGWERKDFNDGKGARVTSVWRAG